MELLATYLVGAYSNPFLPQDTVAKLKTPKMAPVYDFRIILAKSDPVIWRTVRISGNYRLDRFHQVIQLAMGWNNSHLHEFRINGRDFGMEIDEEYEFFFEDETEFHLSDFNLKERDTLSYLYDFGDHWEHVLYLEQIGNIQEATHPICTGGWGACPPDDSGGIYGYKNLTEILSNPQHPEYAEWRHWLPRGFQPDRFPIDAANAELSKFGAWHLKHPRKKSTPWHQI